MLFLILFLLLIGLVVMGLFWVGTLTIQGYWYSEPTPGLAWRAPAAGAVLMLFLALWCFLNLRATDPKREHVPYHTLFQFAPTEADPPEGFVFFDSIKNGKKARYERRSGVIDVSGRRLGAGEYVESKTGRAWHSRDADGTVEAVEIPFPDPAKPDDKKAYVMRPYKLVDGKPDTFRADNGETITKDDIGLGQITHFRWDILFISIAMNVLNFGLAFVVLWLLLRYQWAHALGLAVIVWLVLTLGVLPPLFSQTRLAATPSVPETPPATKP